jgi:hypothetical protein
MSAHSESTAVITTCTIGSKTENLSFLGTRTRRGNQGRLQIDTEMMLFVPGNPTPDETGEVQLAKSTSPVSRLTGT